MAENSEGNLISGTLEQHIFYSSSPLPPDMAGISPVIETEMLTDLLGDDNLEDLVLVPNDPPPSQQPPPLLPEPAVKVPAQTHPPPPPIPAGPPPPNNSKKPRGGNTNARGFAPKKPTQKKRYQCTVESCQYSTPYGKDLTRHMRKHTGEKPFRCQKCEKSFSRYDKLKTHVMTHDGIRPYKCHVCEYCSVDSGSLRKHVRTHTNERPFKCQLCPYKAKDSSQLVVHLRHHTGDSPYSCVFSGCSAAFKTPSDLQRHCRLHTGEKPYACPQCPYRAAVKCNLNAHMRKAHPSQATNSSTSSSTVVVPIILDPGEVGAMMSQEDQDVSSLTNSIYLSTPIELEALPSLADFTSPNGSGPGDTSTSGMQQQGPNSAATAGAKKTEAKKPQRRRMTKPKPKLPFQYACKSCPAKCDSLKAFKNHVTQVHKDISLAPLAKSVQEEAKSVIVSPSSSKGRVLKTDVVKLFECDFCPASFARKDSLGVHLKQHNNLTSPMSTCSSIVVPPPDIVQPQPLVIPGTLHYPPADPNKQLLSHNPMGTEESSIILRSETAVIAGQTQKVYVIVRNTHVLDKQQGGNPGM